MHACGVGQHTIRAHAVTGLSMRCERRLSKDLSTVDDQLSNGIIFTIQCVFIILGTLVLICVAVSAQGNAARPPVLCLYNQHLDTVCALSVASVCMCVAPVPHSCLCATGSCILLGEETVCGGQQGVQALGGGHKVRPQLTVKGAPPPVFHTSRTVLCDQSGSPLGAMVACQAERLVPSYHDKHVYMGYEPWLSAFCRSPLYASVSENIKGLTTIRALGEQVGADTRTHTHTRARAHRE